MKNGLFPDFPKDLAKLEDKELADLLAEFEHAIGLVQAKDEEFLKGLAADDIVTQAAEGRDHILALREETTKRVEDSERFEEALEEITTSLAAPAEVKAEEDAGDGGDGDENGEGEGEGDEEKPAEAEATAEAEVADPVKEILEPVLASADEPVEPARPMRRLAPAVPTPAEDRIVVNEKQSIAFIASGLVPSATPGTRFETPGDLAQAMEKTMRALGRPSKSREGREDHYKVATLDYGEMFPAERTLTADGASNSEKIAAIGNPFLGIEAMQTLIASGGLCAPLEPIYAVPQFASRARPVRDGLPSFRAMRGGINVPTPPVMGDAAAAITVITEAEDALGGTFATKACLDFDCPAYTETAVTIISHCREFGNLVSMSWPEFIAAQNDLTMAEHARVAESYLLGRLKTLSVNVTSGATTLSALSYLVDAIMKSKYGIRSRLRLPNEVRFTAFLPRVLGDILEVDTVLTQFDRYKSLGELEAFLSEKGIDVNWYMDTPLQVGDATAAPGDSQIADAAQGVGALEAFPTTLQWALHPQGTFLHLDMAELNLGIVRDSTLNSTNDYQVFGEVFENVARIGPAQAAYWETTTYCASGQFPPAGTARTCP
jgi:hypothetical protein